MCFSSTAPLAALSPFSTRSCLPLSPLCPFALIRVFALRQAPQKVLKNKKRKPSTILKPMRQQRRANNNSGVKQAAEQSKKYMVVYLRQRNVQCKQRSNNNKKKNKKKGSCNRSKSQSRLSPDLGFAALFTCLTLSHSHSRWRSPNLRLLSIHHLFAPPRSLSLSLYLPHVLLICSFRQAILAQLKLNCLFFCPSSFALYT